MIKLPLRLVSPTTEIRTVSMPRRKPNAELRTREYLTTGEIEKLIKAASQNRHGHRDATMILTAYRHGLRVSEICDLRWDQVDFLHARMAVRRVKKGTPSTHPIEGDELRALRRLQREQNPPSPFVFTSERGAPFGTPALPACWSALAWPPSCRSRRIHICCATRQASRWPTKGRIRGRSRAILAIAIQHTVKYTELSPTRFKDLWR